MYFFKTNNARYQITTIFRFQWILWYSSLILNATGYNILKISTFAAEKESSKCQLSNVPAETLFCKNCSGALLSHDIFCDMGVFSTCPSLQSSAYLHVLCSRIMFMPLRNWIYFIFTFLCLFVSATPRTKIRGILVSPIRDWTWALLAEKAQSANQWTSGEVPVSTVLNLNRFTWPRANFLNSAFSGSVQARRIGYGLSDVEKSHTYMYMFNWLTLLYRRN